MTKQITYFFVGICIFTLISLISTTIFLTTLLTLNLLPLRYLIPITATILALFTASTALIIRYFFLPFYKNRKIGKSHKAHLAHKASPTHKINKTAQARQTHGHRVHNSQSDPKPLPILLAIIIQAALTTFSLVALHYLSHANTFIDKITTTNSPTPQPQKSLNLAQDPFNIFIGGVDASNQLSDVNMILSVNPKTRQILITGIPRDYYVPFHNSKQKDKLTHSGAFMGADIENTMLTVSDFMKIDLNYYFRVDFNSITTLVNTLGGITIYSDTTFRSSVTPKCYFHTGQNHISGACALAFARERKNYKNGDLHRVENQAIVMEAIIHKLSNPKILSSHYEQLLADFANVIKTNLPKNYLTDFIRFELDQTPSWQVEKYRLSGTHVFNVSSPHAKNLPSTVIEPDQNSIKIARQKIKKLHSAKR